MVGRPQTTTHHPPEPQTSATIPHTTIPASCIHLPYRTALFPVLDSDLTPNLTYRFGMFKYLFWWVEMFPHHHTTHHPRPGRRQNSSIGRGGGDVTVTDRAWMNWFRPLPHHPTPSTRLPLLQFWLPRCHLTPPHYPILSSSTCIIPPGGHSFYALFQERRHGHLRQNCIQLGRMVLCVPRQAGTGFPVCGGTAGWLDIPNTWR